MTAACEQKSERCRAGTFGKSRARRPGHLPCGRRTSYTDTEDIAIKANEIAPGRFTWRKYKEQINIETVRKRLWDATKAEKGGYLVGSERDGWLLTQTGLKFCKKHLRLLKVSDGSSTRRSQREQTWISRERVRMLAEPAYQKFATGQMKSDHPG